MHKTLYREYRPQKFSDIIGQDHIVRTLTNQIKENSIGHAYLFCGTRGTGKTSTAKIFSRAVNCTCDCEDVPCNKCESCVSISDNSSLDVIEIDAASNNSVDDVREIRENIRYSPSKSRFKVYIIDEVHMLSQGAFNALLKTLEEPPEYVIFILATTEPNKIPATILSRCQRYDFKNVGIRLIYDRMAYILNEQNIEFEKEALQMIARNAQGALRDALSILEQCISYTVNDRITYDDVIEVLGTANPDRIFELCTALLDMNPDKGLTLLDEFISWGKDIKVLITDIIYFYRNMLVLSVSERVSVALPEYMIERIKAANEGYEVNSIIRAIDILSTLTSDIRNASSPRIAAEIAFIKIAQPSFDSSDEAFLDRLRDVEQMLEGKVFVDGAQDASDMSYQSYEKSLKDIKDEIRETRDDMKGMDDTLMSPEEQKRADSIKEGWRLLIENIYSKEKTYNKETRNLLSRFRFAFDVKRIVVKSSARGPIAYAVISDSYNISSKGFGPMDGSLEFETFVNGIITNEMDESYRLIFCFESELKDRLSKSGAQEENESSLKSQELLEELDIPFEVKE